jgi:hypothetical protein
MVLDHVEPTISALLVSKYWYSKLIKQRFKDHQLSTSMVANIQNLSKETLAIMMRNSEDLSIVVSKGDTPATCHLGLSTFENDMNNCLQYLADVPPSFQALKSFRFCNRAERETSWRAILLKTAEKTLSSISYLPLKYVKIKMPGAPFESRSHMLYLDSHEPHGCDLIRL